MRLSLAQLTPCIKSKKYTVYVLYGSQEALIQGVIREVTELFSYQNKQADQLEFCIQDLAMPSLFGSKPLVTVFHSVKPSLLTFLSGQWPTDHVAIALVASCPPALIKDPKIATVACYESTFAESKVIFQRYVERYGLKMDPEAFEFCVEFSRDGKWSEMAQMLKVCQEGLIRYETVSSLFPEACPELFLAFLGTHFLDLEKVVIEEPIKVLRLWQKLVMQMWQLKFYSKTQSFEHAVKQVHPPIFFKNVPLLIKAMVSWDEVRLIKTMDSFLTLEILVKKNPAHADMLVVRFLRDRLFN